MHRRPRWGHALRRQGADRSDTTDPDFYEQNEMNTDY
jgi:hypothetical protein